MGSINKQAKNIKIKVHNNDIIRAGEYTQVSDQIIIESLSKDVSLNSMKKITSIGDIPSERPLANMTLNSPQPKALISTPSAQAKNESFDGYYYTREGDFLGKLGSTSEKVWIIGKSYFDLFTKGKDGQVTRKICEDFVNNRKEIYNNHKEFNYLAGVLYAEGPSKWEESAAIYCVLKNRANLHNTTIAEEATAKKGVYGAKNADKINDIKANKNWVKNAYKAIIEVVLFDSDTDFSNGAYFWDGKDFNGKNTQKGGYNERYVPGYKFTEKSHDLWNQGDNKKPGENKFGKTVLKWDYKYESTQAEGGTTFSKLSIEWREAQMPGEKKANEMGGK